MALSLQYDEAKIIADYFARHPRTGVMIDVGAHFGTSFKPYLREGWRVFAYEPDSTKLEKIEPFLSNPLFTFSRAAVSDEVKEGVQFYTSPESTGIASLVAFRESHSPSEKVSTTTLAIEVAKHKIDKLDYLKVDTEGYDLHVLKGHDWSVRPEVIMCEFDEIKTRPQGFGHRAIGDLLRSHDYVVYCSEWAPLVRYGSGHAWHAIAEYPCELHHADAWGNYIAIRPDAWTQTMAELVKPHT